MGLFCGDSKWVCNWEFEKFGRKFSRRCGILEVVRKFINCSGGSFR